MEREIENPMVLDDFWPEYDAIDAEMREEIEAQIADEERDANLPFEIWSREASGYVL